MVKKEIVNISKSEAEFEFLDDFHIFSCISRLFSTKSGRRGSTSSNSGSSQVCVWLTPLLKDNGKAPAASA